MKSDVLILLGGGCAIACSLIAFVAIVAYGHYRGGATMNNTGPGSGFTMRVGTTLPAPSSEGIVNGAGSTPTSKQCPSWAAPSARAALPGYLGPWQPIADKLIARAKSGSFDVVFMGDSITQLLEYETKQVMDAAAPKLGKVGIFGIGGDTVEGLTWRTCHGFPQAKVYVITIGTNNIASTPPDQIGSKVVELAKFVRASNPNSHVLVLGIFWRTSSMDKVDQANSTIKAGVRQMDARTHYIDWGTKLSAGDYTDGVHPNAGGWTKIMDKLVPYISSLK